jgi:hypothetical protein
MTGFAQKLFAIPRLRHVAHPGMTANIPKLLGLDRGGGLLCGRGRQRRFGAFLLGLGIRARGLRRRRGRAFTAGF